MFHLGFCTCPSAHGLFYLRTGETTRRISWKEPTPSCGEYEIALDTTKTIVNPSLVSPSDFAAGNYNISYMYFFKHGKEKISCFVHLEIKGIFAQSHFFSEIKYTFEQIIILKYLHFGVKHFFG